MEEFQHIEEKKRFSLRDITPVHVGVGAVTGLICLGIDLFGGYGSSGLFFGGLATAGAVYILPDMLSPVIEDVRDIWEGHSRFQLDKATRLLDDGHDTVVIPEVSVPPQTRLLPVFPIYPERETLRLGTVTTTGQRFDPHFDDMIGKGFIAAAVQGSGKSMLCGLVLEQAGKCDIPMIVLDHKGEYDSALPFVNGMHVGATHDYTFMLTPENAYQLVAEVMNSHYQAVVNLPSYGLRWLDKARIVAAVGRALMEYAERQRLRGRTPLPCLVLLDEAQLYIPQNINLLPPEARKNTDVLDDLSNAYFSLVSNGRSNGYTMFFATQSLTYIAKWAIKSCQIRVFMRHAEKNDLDMCESIIHPEVATREELETFAPGTGVVFGFTQKPMVITFDKKESPDTSETPKIARLREPRQLVSLPRGENPFSLLPEQRGSHTRHPQIEDEEQAIVSESPLIHTARLSSELQMVLDVYQTGMSHRDLASLLTERGLKVSHVTAGKLLQRLKDMRRLDSFGQRI